MDGRRRAPPAVTTLVRRGAAVDAAEREWRRESARAAASPSRGRWSSRSQRSPSDTNRTCARQQQVTRCVPKDGRTSGPQRRRRAAAEPPHPRRHVPLLLQSLRHASLRSVALRGDKAGPAFLGLQLRWCSCGKSPRASFQQAEASRVPVGPVPSVKAPTWQACSNRRSERLPTRVMNEQGYTTRKAHISSPADSAIVRSGP